MSKTPKVPWNVGSRLRFKTHLEFPWEIVAGKAIWKNSSMRRVLGQPAEPCIQSAHSFLTGTKSSALPQIFRILMISAGMDKTCIKKCSPGDLYNYFLMKLLKIRTRVKFCIPTLTSRALWTPENPLFFFWNSVHHSPLPPDFWSKQVMTFLVLSFDSTCSKNPSFAENGGLSFRKKIPGFRMHFITHFLNQFNEDSYI